MLSPSIGSSNFIHCLVWLGVFQVVFGYDVTRFNSSNLLRIPREGRVEQMQHFHQVEISERVSTNGKGDYSGAGME